MTTSVGIRELKDSLSRYVRLARDGERVVVLDRGHPVAILAPIEGSAASTVAEHLAGLAARGMARLGTGWRRGRRPQGPSVDLSGTVIEDRDERT